MCLQTVLGFAGVKGVEMCVGRSLMGYTGPESIAFIKITASDNRALPKLRGSFERGDISFRDMWEGGTDVLTYENIAYTLRFMIDRQVSPDLGRVVDRC